MGSSAPIEIWTKIFEEIIDVPEFFSTDPLTTYGAGSWSRFVLEGFYWRAERWRNALRRVHTSWNAVLNQPIYRHRFVRMSDVTHGRLEKEEIPWEKTLRIAFDAEPECVCEKYYNPSRFRGAKSEKCWKILELMGEIVVKHGRRTNKDSIWRLRTVDVTIWSLDLSKLLLTVSGTTNITAIKGITDWITVTSYAHNLRFLQITFDPFSSSNSIASPLSFPHLTTLIVRLASQMFDCQHLHVPSLRHLYVQCSYVHRDQQGLEKLIKVVSTLGSNLRTLHYWNSLDQETTSQFWQLVPNLTRIRLACQWTSPPPRDHPLQMVQIGSGSFNIPPPRPESDPSFHPHAFRKMPGWVQWSTSTPVLVGPDHGALLAEWAGRSFRVALGRVWERIIFHPRSLQTCLFFSEEYGALGWIFTDCTGWTFSMFLVYLLERRRKAKMAGMWEWIPRGYPRSGPRWTEDMPRVGRQRMGEGDRDIQEAEMYDLEYF